MSVRSSAFRAVLAAACVLAVAAPTASAASTQQRWVLTGAAPVPLTYLQGLTHDPAGRCYFTGFFRGGARTDGNLRQQAISDNLIPPSVDPIGFNHIGDPTYDRAEGGRVILPLECYIPGRGNTCGMGGFGVLDPATLTWRYWVRLDQADIPKAMWVEESPDGRRLWTSSGDDLVAYAAADVVSAHAATTATSKPLKPVARLKGAVPPSGVTGGTFVAGRLLLAGEADKTLQVWSVDVKGSGRPRLEVTLPGVAGEPEGLDLRTDARGSLHWIVGPDGDNGPATYGTTSNALLSFVPVAGARLGVKATQTSAGLAVRATVRSGRRTYPAARATVTALGQSALTGSDGRATLPTAGRSGRAVVIAASAGLRARASVKLR